MNIAPMRAAGRIAWRSARRNLGRSLLVLVMIAAPVAMVVSVATVARTMVADPAEEATQQMGAADMVATGRPNRLEARELEGRLPEGSQVVESTTRYSSLVKAGTLWQVTTISPDVPIDAPIFEGLYEVLSGRAPSAVNEVALHPELAEAFDVGIGDDVALHGENLRITGIARAPFDLDTYVAFIGPGTFEPERGTWTNWVYVDLPPGVTPDSVHKEMRPVLRSSLTRGEVADVVARDALVWEGVAFTGGVLALFATGLVAAAAFVVGARRQLRALGLVGAVGGEPRHVRMVVLLGGTSIGLLGASLGAVAGVGLAFAAHPFLDDLAGRVVGPVDINELVLVAAVVLGTLAATAAAYLPARAAGKVSSISALAGRTPPPRPPGRVAGWGGLVLLGGAALTAWATLRDRPGLIAAGLIGMLLGILFAIPLLVTALGKVARGLPATGRLAARETARHGRRTGAAVAAAVLALCIPIGVATYSLSEETFERRSPRIGEDHLLIGARARLGPEASEAFVEDMSAAFPEAGIVPLEHAITPRDGGGQGGFPIWAVAADERIATTYSSLTVHIGDAETLRALHAEAGTDSLVAGKALTLGDFSPKNGVVSLQVPGPRSVEQRHRIPAVAIDSPSYFLETMPRVVISHQVAADLGLESRREGHLLAAPGALSSEDIARARDVASDHPGYYVLSADDYLPRYALVRGAVTAATLPLGLAILSVAVALVAAESRRSHQILVAVGAGPIAHRKVVGMTSGLLAAIAAVLAIPAGILPTIVLQVASQAGRPIVIPWLTIAIVVLVTPLACAIIAGLVARSPRIGSLLSPAS